MLLWSGRPCLQVVPGPYYDVNVHVLSTEPCPAERSDVVHKYSPRNHHNDDTSSYDETVPLSHLDTDDEEDTAGTGSSDGTQPATRARYGRRYDPADPVIIVEHPTVTELTQSGTGHSVEITVTTSGASITTCSLLSVVQLALSLLTIDWTTAQSLVFCLFHCRVDCLCLSPSYSVRL